MNNIILNQKTGQTQVRIIKYDILRIVACFAIVLLHVSSSVLDTVNVHSSEFLIMIVYNSLTSFAVPIFFMLSGLFLLSPDRENIKLGKRILKLVSLFYVWSAFYGFQGIIFDVLTGGGTKEFLLESIRRFISGHLHMWFIQTLLGFYILIPIARQICAEGRCLQYFLILWVVFKFFIPCLTEAFHLSIIQSQVNSLGLDILTGNLGYFLLGYYLNTTGIKKHIRLIIYVMGIIATYLTIFLTIHDSAKSGIYVETWFGAGSLNICVMSTAIFIWFKYCRAFDSIKYPNLWKKLSRCTFFVYMFHIFLIEKLSVMGITVLSYSVIISIPVFTIIIFMVSLLCGYVTERIPIIRKIALFY